MNKQEFEPVTEAARVASSLADVRAGKPAPTACSEAALVAEAVSFVAGQELPEAVRESVLAERARLAAILREGGETALAAALPAPPAAAPVVAKAPPSAEPGVLAEPLDDAGWFQSTGRSVRLRERREEDDPAPFWLANALAGAGVMTVVRNMRGAGRELHVEALPLDALGGERPVDTDEGILAALRAARGWR